MRQRKSLCGLRYSSYVNLRTSIVIIMHLTQDTGLGWLAAAISLVDPLSQNGASYCVGREDPRQ